MPFSSDTAELLGQELQIKPVYGNGWGLYGQGDPIWLETPGTGLNATVTDVLFDGKEARVLICQVELSIMTHQFKWGAFLARSDYLVDLRKRSIHCNMIFSKERPSISSDNPYPSPDFVTPNADPHVRGFGVVSLAGH